MQTQMKGDWVVWEWSRAGNEGLAVGEVLQGTEQIHATCPQRTQVTFPDRSPTSAPKFRHTEKSLKKENRADCRNESGVFGRTIVIRECVSKCQAVYTGLSPLEWILVVKQRIALWSRILNFRLLEWSIPPSAALTSPVWFSCQG